MGKHISTFLQRTLAVLLCVAMILPMVAVPGFATEVTEPTIAEITETQPETTVPETTVPETTAPEATVPETTVPETTAPEETVPETTAPEETVPETTAPEETVPETTAPEIEESEEELEFALFAGNLPEDIQITESITIPGYWTRGKISANVLESDCGNGITQNGEKSYLVMVTGTNADEFETYKTTLEEAGYIVKMEKETASKEDQPNLFASYLSSDKTYKLYTYYLSGYGETRIIVDTQKDTVEGYKYEAGEAVTTPKMVMWGLSTSPSGYHIDTSVENGNTGRENNGVMLIMRMKDNSLFFYDGGILAQMSDAESAELLAFCRELTGTPVGKKMVINTWFVSHAHDDHFQAFGRFINIHHNQFDLKNVVYNIDKERGDVEDLGSNKSTTPASKKLTEALDVIREHYPNVRYYKPHTGETFDVAGVKFDVLYTHEDRFLPQSWDNQLQHAVDQLSNSQIDMLEVGGSYRTELYKDKDNRRSDFNDTSTVLRVNFENGVKGLLYGDLNLAENILEKVYPTSDSANALKADIILVPHHLFDDHADLVQYANAKTYLISQNKTAVYGADNDYTTAKEKDGTCRNDLRENFVLMMNRLASMGKKEGQDFDVFWGGSETVTIDINALGRELGYTPATRAATTGSYYTTEPANSFTYTKNAWSVTSPASAEYQSVVNSVGDYQSVENAIPVAVTTHQIVFKNHGDAYFHQEGRYLMMNDKWGYIMSFDATAIAEISDTKNEQYGTSYTGSFVLDPDGNSENTYYIDENGYVILDHSDRHFALWNMRQYAQATGGTTLGNTIKLKASENTTFAGTAQFAGIELQKRTMTHNPYWYIRDLAIGEDYQLRHFCFKSDTTCFKNQYRNSLQTTNTSVYGDQTGSRVKFILDSLGDGTYLLYYKESNTDYRVVTCDNNGRWDVVRYQGDSAVSNMKKDYNKLKLRFYDYVEMEENKRVAFSGYQRYYVSQGTSVISVKNDIAANVTVFDPDHRNQHIPYDGSEVTVTNIGGTRYAVEKKAGYYWLDTYAVNTSVAGEYPVAIKYRNDDGSDTTVGEVKVIVGGSLASISNKSGTVAKNSSLTTVVSIITGEESKDATFKYNGSVKNITVGMLKDANGNPVDTSKPGTYNNLKLYYNDVLICSDYTLTVAESNLTLDYPIYPEEGSVKVDKSGKELTKFKETGVAQIELSATAKPLDKGVDLIVIMDLSSSMRYYTNSSDYACGPKYNTDGTLNKNTTGNLEYAYSDAAWKNTRLYALEEALKEMVTTLSVDSNSNVRIAMADFGDLDHYEFEDAALDDTPRAKPYLDSNKSGGGSLDQLKYEMSNHVNFVQGRDDESFGGISQPFYNDWTKYNQTREENENGAIRKYTGKVLPKIYTGSHTLSAEAFQDVHDLNMDTIIDDMRKMNGKRLGTNYDIGLETAYRLAYARQQANIAAGEDREIVCIFMSDGAAMQYNYLSGRSQTEAWSQCITGNTDEILTSYTDRYVITSDYADTSVNQNPLLKQMLEKLAGLLGPVNDQGVIRSSMLNPTTGAYYPAYTGDSTDLFEMMEGIGVDCDWELLWQIAWKNYTVAEGNSGYYNALKLSGLNYGMDVNFCENTLGAVVASLRKPSYNANGTQWQYQILSPYYYFYNAEGKNWWAEALKGDSNQLYPVISRFAFKDSTEWGDKASANFYYGDVRNRFSTGTGLALDGQDYVAGFRGLNIDLYTIGFSLGTENRIDFNEAAQVLANIASGTAFHYDAASGEKLTEALQSIVGSMSVAATGAYFTDTMGPEFDLSTEKIVNGHKVNASPTIRVLEYTLDGNGKRTGDSIVREIITFEGGKVAKSDQVYTVDSNGNKSYPDIWDNETNLISGKFVKYNASTTAQKIDLTGDGVGDYTLDGETFFWTIGTLGKTEMVLEYQVYLTGSMDGDRDIGFYDTNTSATLNYVNYLGNNCHKDTVTPAFPWPDAVVGYGFYLVDVNGNPLNVNGDISSFTDSVKIGDVEYIQMNLNSDQKTIIALDKLTGQLDEKYDLYDLNAQYQIHVDSTLANNQWVITTENGTTYVTNYGGPPTTQNSSGDSNVAYDRTVVWFAVVVTPKLNPDTVVIDYGLPVEIDVLTNDGSIINDVVAIAGNDTLPANGLATLDDAFVADEAINGKHGKLELLVTDKVKYTLNSMEMPSEDVFRYAAQASGRYYYSTVTVIPATTIYYEDSFVTFKVKNYEDAAVLTDAKYANLQWQPATESTSNATQAEDRPGQGLAALDANNVYGYDGAYTNMSQYSLGNAMKVTVGKHTVGEGETAEEITTYGTAEFTFWGTGFDVISLTSAKTGTVVVKVKGIGGKAAGVSKNYMVDTYYGYKYEDGKWVVDTSATESNALYQIPVMKVEDLVYGQYQVTISASHKELYDHSQYETNDKYDFYLDAIRIYDPANDGKDNLVIENAYKDDGEGWPEYFELRDLLISSNDFNALADGQQTSGAVFLDNTETSGNKQEYTVADYKNYGPNNELYLAPGQAVTFKLNVPAENLANIHLALKGVNGAVSAQVYDADDSNKTNKVPATIETATDLYYDVTGLNGKTVVIKNNGNANILSITNFKVTYTSAHTDGLENSFFTINTEGVKLAMMSLRRPVVEEPEEIVPETTAPEETVPETTVPEETVPETTVPETTAPAEPEAPEVFEPGKFHVQLSASSVKVGSSVVVTVTTGQDVDHITVNGEAVTRYTGSRWSKTRTWQVKVKAETAGEQIVEVICYNAKDLASVPVVKTVTVTAQYTSVSNWLTDVVSGILGGLLGKWR